jgi:nucleoid DNA-binding protein
VYEHKDLADAIATSHGIAKTDAKNLVDAVSPRSRMLLRRGEEVR